MHSISVYSILLLIHMHGLQFTSLKARIACVNIGEVLQGFDSSPMSSYCSARPLSSSATKGQSRQDERSKHINQLK
jgi:hypothetical protein